MKSTKILITLTGSVCFTMGALATTTAVAEDVSSKGMAPVVAQASQVAVAPAVAEISQAARAPLMTGAPVSPTLANVWEKHQCFVVLSGNCL